MNYLNQLARTLDQNYAKLPALPKGVKDFIVLIAPWLALIFGALAILAGISAFRALSFISSIAIAVGANGYTFTAIFSIIILFLQGVIELLAFSPLKANKVRGWNLMYYSLVLGFISSVVTLSVSNILGSLLGVLIGYYILYQVKSYYK